ncbi:MAG: hypothetical protein JXB18_03990 [Sedimentisphaerales bacterium]|nr:hypothetical protein [Sedimentisphaerales bacterium]
MHPELLLFGSSRCLSLKPEIENVNSLNVSLYAGAIEDHYCLLRYAVEDLKFPVHTVVVGLEPDLLVDNQPINPMLKRNTILSRYLLKNDISVAKSNFFCKPGYIDEVASLLSTTTLSDSLRVVFKYLLNIFRVSEAGAATSENPEKSVNLIKTILEKITVEKDSLESRLRQYKNLYAGSTKIDPERLQYLDDFAEYAQRHEIHVLIFIPGYSKNFWKEMHCVDSFVEIQGKFDRVIHNLVETYGFKVIDFRPVHWRGPELEFFDGVHPTKHTAEIIDAQINRVISDGF